MTGALWTQTGRNARRTLALPRVEQTTVSCALIVLLMQHLPRKPFKCAQTARLSHQKAWLANGKCCRVSGKSISYQNVDCKLQTHTTSRRSTIYLIPKN
jgi:hypothetical protein